MMVNNIIELIKAWFACRKSKKRLQYVKENIDTMSREERLLLIKEANNHLKVFDNKYGTNYSD